MLNSIACETVIYQSCLRVGWTRGSSRVGSGRIGSGPVRSGRAGSGHDFAGFWRVRSGQYFGFLSFSQIISWYLNRYESSNTAFGLIFYDIYYLIYKN